MIKTKNLGEYILELSTTGAQSASAHAASTTCSVIVPFAGRLKAVFGRLGVAGVTSTQTSDILLNGTTMLASGTVLSYATTSVVPTYNVAFLTSPPVFAKGDVLTLKNTAIHSGTAADDQCVFVTIERQRSGSFAEATVQTDTIGSDSDQI